MAVTVSQYTTSTAITSNPTSPTVGESVTFTATLSLSGGSSPTGTVQFVVDGSNYGSPVALGGTSASVVLSGLTNGNHSLAATYSGDTNFSGSSNSTTFTMANPSGVVPSGGAVYTISAGSDFQNIDVESGTVTLASDLSTEFPNYSLQVNSGAYAVLGAFQHNVSNVYLSGSAQIDIKSFGIFNTDAYPAPFHDDALSVGYGYNGGAWNGQGIISSLARANPLTAVGYINTGSEVVIAYTYFGDANLDGKVDGSDYSIIDNSYLQEHSTGATPITGWNNGDFNYDGVVDGSDYTLIDNAFNRQANTLASVASPETQLGQNGSRGHPVAAGGQQSRKSSLANGNNHLSSSVSPSLDEVAAGCTFFLPQDGVESSMSYQDRLDEMERPTS